ncbi:MAG: 6-oxopurine nucleoside phosphorylase [Thermoplasmata archaeon]|nr:MAG: 6-oxopurine nucleoside phosphorylase [Thermoplasmata archaeon]
MAGVLLGLIGGTGSGEIGRILAEKDIVTPYGRPSSPLQYIDVEGERIVYLRRHGVDGNIPPHRINHRANIYALKKENVPCIVSITSVGSLKKNIVPPSILIPHDYICPWKIPTFYSEVRHVTPSIDERLREIIIEGAKNCNLSVLEKGIYIQTLGPRLETKAEVSVMAYYADVVGMSMASEATLASEIGMSYANISSVDNYAHGIVDVELRYEDIIRNAKNNWGNIVRLIREVVRLMAR